MTALVVFPKASDAFSKYKPSSNAHTDILTASSPTGARAAKVVRLCIPQADAQKSDQERLNTLRSVISAILSGQKPPISNHQAVATCRDLIQRPARDYSLKLYESIVSELKSAIERLGREARGVIMSRDTNWLDYFVDAWHQFEGRVGLLASVFVYLDRVYCSEASGNTTIQERAKELFRTHIWDSQLVFTKTRDEIMAWATAEREAEDALKTRRYAVMGVVTVAKHLGTFESIAKPYNDLTRSYYQDLAATHAANVESGVMTGTDYVTWVLSKEGEERQRATECLASTVSDDISTIIHTEGGEKVAARVVPKALDEAMTSSDTEALTQLYRFCTQAKAINLMTKSLQAHIEKRLKGLISDPANDPQMIDTTLKLKRFVDKAVSGLFASAPKTKKEDGDGDAESEPVSQGVNGKSIKPQDQIEMEDGVRQGFKAGLGSRQNAPAECIAKHLDSVMRKGQGSGTDAQFNTLLNEIIALVSFTPDKDVFRAFYSSGLAKRLLLNKSASDDLERNMIVKLQNEMGDEFTSGDVMMKDLQLSETLAQRYAASRAKDGTASSNRGSVFTANVLTESAWPPYPLLKDGWDFRLTPELQASLDSFSAWYTSQHQSRVLSWRHQLGTVTMSARFDSGKYEIGVSLFQAVVLLQFNEVDVLDFTELKNRTGIESSELVRTLQSLALGRKGTRVLLKRPSVKEVEPTDKFAINKGFSSERIKFKINQIQQDLSAEESRTTNEQVLLDRVSILEATIVRIMKARKKLTLTLLIDAVVSDVSKRFPPDVKEIKKRVESLIEREFLMRDDNDKNTLHYLA